MVRELFHEPIEEHLQRCRIERLVRVQHLNRETRARYFSPFREERATEGDDMLGVTDSARHPDHGRFLQRLEDPSEEMRRRWIGLRVGHIPAYAGLGPVVIAVDPQDRTRGLSARTHTETRENSVAVSPSGPSSRANPWGGRRGGISRPWATTAATARRIRTQDRGGRGHGRDTRRPL